MHLVSHSAYLQWHSPRGGGGGGGTCGLAAARVVLSPVKLTSAPLRCSTAVRMDSRSACHTDAAADGYPGVGGPVRPRLSIRPCSCGK